MRVQCESGEEYMLRTKTLVSAKLDADLRVDQQDASISLRGTLSKLTAVLYELDLIHHLDLYHKKTHAALKLLDRPVTVTNDD